MVKNLPIYTPIIDTYPEYGLLFSIIGNNEKVNEWIYCNLVQMHVLQHKKLDYFFICFSDHHSIMSNCPCVRSYAFPENMIYSIFNNSYVAFLKHCLNSNMYIKCLLDYSSIRSLSKNILHNCFFYGYDSEKKIFYARDNLDSGKFGDFEISFNEVEKSLCAVSNKSVDNTTLIQTFIVIESNPHNLFEFNMQYLYNELRSYLGINQYNKKLVQNINIIESYRALFERVAYLNLDIYEFFIDIVLNDMVDGYDNKSFYLLYEHKKIMENRIEYLTEKGLIPYNQELIIQANEVFDISHKLLNIVIKMNVKRCKDNFKLKNLLLDIKEKEIVLINKLIDEIQTTYNF